MEQARAHVRKATAAFNLGHYGEAAREYEAAYEKTLDPNMLFNVGQAWRLAGERQKALTAYRSFLRSAPKGGERSVAEAKIKELEEERPAQMPSAPTVPPEAAPAAATPGADVPPSASAVPTLTPALAPQPPSASSVTSSESARNESAADSTARPFYTRWPFWTGVGVVVAAGVVTGIILASGRASLTMPPTDYGVKHY